jgi:protoporphyrinogen oxidase
MQPPVGDDVRAAADDIHFRDHLTVALVVPEDAAFPDNWIYVHDPTARVGRIQNFGSWSPYMVKEGRTCLGMEYFVFEGDDLWEMADADLVELGKRELDTLGLVSPDKVEAGYVVRMPRAYPTYDEHYRANVDVLRKWLTENTTNVYPVGRNGMHKYNNQDHSMYTAMLTVENIVNHTAHDIWSVNVEAEYHEEIADAGGDTTGRDAPVIPRRAMEEAAEERQRNR